MFNYLQILVPSDEECIKIAREATEWILPQVKSAYKDMNEVVKYLGTKFDLYTSSGGDYRLLSAYYKSQGIISSFKKIIGADTVGVFKSHPQFFERLFRITGVNPKNSIIIDDKEAVLDLCHDYGAKCILSNISGNSKVTGKYPVYHSPEELLDLLSNITNVNLLID